MARLVNILVFASAVVSCSPETGPVENMSGQELTDRLTRDLEAVENTNPDSLAETVVAISELESAREFRRRVDEAEQLAAEQHRLENAENAERVRAIEERAATERRAEEQELERRWRAEYSE